MLDIINAHSGDSRFQVTDWFLKKCIMHSKCDRSFQQRWDYDKGQNLGIASFLGSAKQTIEYLTYHLSFPRSCDLSV